MSTVTQTKELKIGDIISIYDKLEYSSEWFSGIVLEIKKSKIKVGFRHYPFGRDKWIDTKTAKIDINKSNIEYVDCQVIGRDIIPPDPCYYNNQIIISIDDHDTKSPGIYSYDIENDKYDIIAIYPEDLSLDRHGMAVDAINDDIYLFSGESKAFAIYNIMNKTWKIKKMDDMPDIRYPTTIYVPSPFDEIYFMGINQKENENVNNSMLSIIKYSKKQKDEKDEKDSLINIMSNFHFTDKLKYSHMIYDEERQRIMLFGGTSDDNYNMHDPERRIHFDDIWMYDISKQNEENKQWQLLSVKLPHHYSSSIKPIYAFNSIVFVLYLDETYKAIWCLELLSNQWFKSHLNLPKEFHGDIVKTDDNYLHCMYYGDDGAYHIKMNLKDMIPPELYTFYSNYYSSLIYGYVQVNIEQIFEYHVANDLKHLISKYYNVLM